MRPGSLSRSLLGLLAILALLVLPSFASARGERQREPETAQPPVETSEGSLEQLPGRLGCLAQGKASIKLCGKARALKGAGPFMGSRAIAISPDGRNVYVASGKSNAIAIFSRDSKTGALTQPQGKAGCVAAKAAEGCALGLGLIAPNSVAVSPDGKNVYATARDSAPRSSPSTAIGRPARCASCRRAPRAASAASPTPAAPRGGR